MPPLPFGNRQQTVHYLVTEARGYRSREQLTIASGSGKLPRGTILGQRTRGAPAAPTSAAVAGNTGNGTLGTLSADAAVEAGIYRVRFLDVDTFAVYDPGGVEVGRGAPGAAYNGPVNFTITAGATPFAAGDGFDVTVAYAAGTLEYTGATEAAADGSDRAAAILYEDIDATNSAVKATGHVRDCEVQRAALAFVGVTNPTYRNRCFADLAAKGIAFR